MGSHPESHGSPSSFGCNFWQSPLPFWNRLPNLIPLRPFCMVPSRTWHIIAFCVLLAATPAFATRTHRAATSGHALHHKGKKHKFTPGQRQIEPERATEIQNALIREHYLSAPRLRPVGRIHRSGHAEIPVRSRLANQTHPRLARAHQARPRPSKSIYRTLLSIRSLRHTAHSSSGAIPPTRPMPRQAHWQPPTPSRTSVGRHWARLQALRDNPLQRTRAREAQTNSARRPQ
jgi:hypothetical protein